MLVSFVNCDRAIYSECKQGDMKQKTCKCEVWPTFAKCEINSIHFYGLISPNPPIQFLKLATNKKPCMHAYFIGPNYFQIKMLVSECLKTHECSLKLFFS